MALFRLEKIFIMANSRLFFAVAMQFSRLQLAGIVVVAFVAVAVAVVAAAVVAVAVAVVAVGLFHKWRRIWRC